MSYENSMPNGPNDVLRALADPNRRAILEQLLRGDEQTVRALTDQAGISQPAVSKHLSILKQAGLVQDRPQGRTVQYRATIEGFTPLIDWIDHYAAFWSHRLDRLEDLLEKMEE